jgi:transposase
VAMIKLHPWNKRLNSILEKIFILFCIHMDSRYSQFLTYIIEVKMSKNVLGIDVSKLELSVCLLFLSKVKHKSFLNDKSGYKSLDKWLSTHHLNNVEVYLEATGKYGDEVTDFLYTCGYVVKVINPLQINSFSKAMLSRHKTDKVDAKIIAEYGNKFEGIKYEPIDENRKKLRSLYRCNTSLKEQITYCINKLENSHLLPKSVKKIWDKTQKHYLEELKHAKEKMIEIIYESHDLKKDFRNLLTVKGIGKDTAITILAELPRFNSFTSARQLAAFIGLIPKHCTSGTSVVSKARISKIGLKGLRKALYFPAIAAKKFNEYFSTFANKLESRGKKPKCIICAIMRKLVHVIYGILKHGEAFNIKKLQSYEAT